MQKLTLLHDFISTTFTISTMNRIDSVLLTAQTTYPTPCCAHIYHSSFGSHITASYKIEQRTQCLSSELANSYLHDSHNSLTESTIFISHSLFIQKLSHTQSLVDISTLDSLYFV